MAPGYLAPLQVGVRFSRGCEAATHSARRYLEAIPNNHILIKLDFSNTFNGAIGQNVRGQNVMGDKI